MKNKYLLYRVAGIQEVEKLHLLMFNQQIKFHVLLL